jgi:plasmid stabilization system protein ParE
MRLKVLREAEDDIAEIARWYEKVNADLAMRFLSEVGDGLALIERHPKRFSAPPHYRGKQEIRRYVLKSFKYMIVYQILPDSLLAICVVHCSRHAKHWKKRARKRKA